MPQFIPTLSGYMSVTDLDWRERRRSGDSGIFFLKFRKNKTKQEQLRTDKRLGAGGRMAKICFTHSTDKLL